MTCYSNNIRLSIAKKLLVLQYDVRFFLSVCVYTISTRKKRAPIFLYKRLFLLICFTVFLFEKCFNKLKDEF